MPKLYTIPEAAKLLRCHPDTIRRRIRDGSLPDRRLPGSIRYLFTYADLVPEPQPSEPTIITQ
jgi:excisionase family DNA binding protein